MVPGRRRPVTRWHALTPSEKLHRLQQAFPADAAAIVSLMNDVWQRRWREIRSSR